MIDPTSAGTGMIRKWSDLALFPRRSRDGDEAALSRAAFGECAFSQAFGEGRITPRSRWKVGGESVGLLMIRTVVGEDALRSNDAGGSNAEGIVAARIGEVNEGKK